MWKNNDKVRPKSPKIAIWGAILGASWSADYGGGGSFCDLVFGTCSEGTPGSSFMVFLMDLGAILVIFGIILGSFSDAFLTKLRFGAPWEQARLLNHFMHLGKINLISYSPCLPMRVGVHPPYFISYMFATSSTFGLAFWHDCTMLFTFIVAFFRLS